MNKANRKDLTAARAVLEKLADFANLETMTNAAIMTDLETAQSVIDTLAEGEREKFDNMSEGLQTSETGQQLEVSADALETASSEIADAVSAVGSPDVANEDRSDDELQSIADCVESALDEIDSIL